LGIGLSVGKGGGGETIDKGRGVTTAEGAVVREAAPPGFDAVTRIRTVAPMSSSPSRWLAAVAPGITTQPVPAESQRSHSIVIVSGAVPDHPPELALRVWPN
jgi:hypothetical protein